MGVQDLSAIGEILVQCEFEVFGQVQGCYFTKFCRDMCKELGVCGWIKNSKQGTIMGKMQGGKNEIDKMVDWLSNVGSPGCKITRCDFKNWGTTARMDYTDFSIRF